MFRTVAVVIAVFYLTANPLAAGQQQGRSVNPEAIEFDTYPVERLGLTLYRVEFFKATAEELDSPIKSIDVDPGLQGDDDTTLRVDVNTVLADLPDGEYVARLRAYGEKGQVDVYVPNEFFILSRQTLTDRERFFRKIGLAIIGGILLVPFLVR